MAFDPSLVTTLKGLFDVGGVVVVTVMLWIVWRRMNDVTDRLIDILTELRAQAQYRNVDQQLANHNDSQSSLKPQNPE